MPNKTGMFVALLAVVAAFFGRSLIFGLAKGLPEAARISSFAMSLVVRGFPMMWGDDTQVRVSLFGFGIIFIVFSLAIGLVVVSRGSSKNK